MVSPMATTQVTFPAVLPDRKQAREDLVWLCLAVRLLETRLLQVRTAGRQQQVQRRTAAFSTPCTHQQHLASGRHTEVSAAVHGRRSTTWSCFPAAGHAFQTGPHLLGSRADVVRVCSSKRQRSYSRRGVQQAVHTRVVLPLAVAVQQNLQSLVAPSLFAPLPALQLSVIFTSDPSAKDTLIACVLQELQRLQACCPAHAPL